MSYQKPKLQRFGDFRELTRIGLLDLAQDGGYYGGQAMNGCGLTPCQLPSTS